MTADALHTSAPPTGSANQWPSNRRVSRAVTGCRPGPNRGNAIPLTTQQHHA